MRGTLTSSESQFEDSLGHPYKINENDPKQLKKIIAGLISKSKTIISTLETTVVKLEKTQKQRDYWKNNYMRFREACQKYIDAEGVQHFKQVSELEFEFKRVEVEKQCLIEESRMIEAQYNEIIRQRSRERGQNRQSRLHPQHQQPKEHQQDQGKKMSLASSKQFKTTKRKQKINKSISTVSFHKEISHSEHRIVPKKICIVLSRDRNASQNQ